MGALANNTLIRHSLHSGSPPAPGFEPLWAKSIPLPISKGASGRQYRPNHIPAMPLHLPQPSDGTPCPKGCQPRVPMLLCEVASLRSTSRAPWSWHPWAARRRAAPRPCHLGLTWTLRIECWVLSIRPFGSSPSFSTLVPIPLSPIPLSLLRLWLRRDAHVLHPPATTSPLRAPAPSRPWTSRPPQRILTPACRRGRIGAGGTAYAMTSLCE
jgi:hypothetical protein